MSAEATGLQIPVSFTLDEARAALRELEAAARTAGKQIGDGLGGEGKKGVDSLTGAFQAFKREQVQQGRMVGFYVREITEFTGASKEATAMMGTLGNVIAEAAAGGIGLGLAFEAVKAGVLIYNKLTEESKKVTSELTQVLSKQREELEKIRFLQGGGSEQTWAVEQQRKANRERLDFLNKEVSLAEDMQAGGTGWVGKSSELTNIANTGESAGPLRAYLGKLYEERSSIIQDLSKAESQAIALDNAEAAQRLAEQEKQRRDEELRRIQEQHQKLLEEERKYQEAFLRAQQEFSVASWQATKGVSGEAGSTIRGQGSVFGLQDSRSPTPQAYADAQAMGRTSSGLQQMGGYGTNQGFQSSAYIEKLQENAQKEQAALRKSQEVWREYGNTVSRAISGVVSGQESAGEAMRSIMQQMMQQLIQYAIQWIMVKAGIVAADTESQWADKGPYGWVIGLAQAAAAMAATLAFSNFGSAETGAALPSSGGPFPFLLHPNEWVLPAPITKGLTGLMENGGGGGSGAVVLNFNGPGWDAKSVEALLVGGGRGTARGLRTLSQKGIR